MATKAKNQTGDTCDPVWRYLLIMRRDLIAIGNSELAAGPSESAEQLIQLAKGIADIGRYSTAAELEPFARFVDEMTERLISSTATLAIDVPLLREKLEELTGWQH